MEGNPPATSTPHKIGKKLDGVIYELFITRLPAPAFSAKDVLDLYLHRGSFETVLTDEDEEQETDRWCSRTPWGQEAWQILNQWVWNLRLELGQSLTAASMRTTEFAAASEPAAVAYGPPQWAHQSFTGGFSGSAFVPQPDGSLLCPAHHPLYAQERRPERDGSLRVLYAARIGDCRTCQLRAQCQESPESRKPQRVSAVLWSVIPSPDPPPPLPPPPDRLAVFSVLWRDWPRTHIRRAFLRVIRTETLDILREGTSLPSPQSSLPPPVLTRPQRAHWRLSWQERLARNARLSTAPSLTLTLHGLPASFAHLYRFTLLEVA